MKKLINKIDLGDVLHVSGVIVFAVAAIAALTWAAMLLWNALIPNIFINGPEINFWQTLGLIVLTNIFIPTVNNKRKRKD